MFVCGLSFCDFVVWTEEGAYTVTVPYDEAFVDVMCRKIEDFWFGHVLPVLIDTQVAEQIPAFTGKNS